MQTINTSQAAQLIHRSSRNTSGHLQRHGIQPIKSSRGYLWPKAAVEALVHNTPELQEPAPGGRRGGELEMGQKRNMARSRQEFAVVCATAAARMRAGIRVGDYDRYSEIPPLTVDDVPAWIWRVLEENQESKERKA